MWILALIAELYFTNVIPPATSIPSFELVIHYKKYIFPATGPATIIAEEDRTHECPLEMFISIANSPPVSEMLMSNMSFARNEADADLFSSMYLIPSIMLYAERVAKKAVDITNLVKLRVEAIIIDDATPVLLYGTPRDPELYMIYQPISFAQLHHSPLTMIDWAETDESCTVCLEDFRSGEKVAHRSCGHYFHRYCIIKWLFQEGNCPICRNSDEVDLDSDSDVDLDSDSDDDY